MKVVNTVSKLVMPNTTRLRTRSNSAFRLIYHLVLVTKFRRKSLNLDILDRMSEIIKELLIKWECTFIEFGGELDHVHILFETHPSVDLSKLVNNIKTITSRKLRSEFSEHLSNFYWGAKPQFWSGSYAIISVGSQAPLEKLIEYVQNQEKPEQ
jgi:putative transposase